MARKRDDKKIVPVPLSEIVPTAEEEKIFTLDFLKKSVDRAVRSATKGDAPSPPKKSRPT